MPFRPKVKKLDYYEDLSGYVPYTGATANVNLGSYDLTATDLTLSGLTATRVIFVGTDGLLSDDAGLTYNSATNALSLAGVLYYGGAGSYIYGDGSTLTLGASILSLSGNATLNGSLNMGSNTLTCGTITNSGTVSSSNFSIGAYILNQGEFQYLDGISSYVYRSGGTDVVVTDGGTGVGTFDAYGGIYGGTTATGNLQSLAAASAGKLLRAAGTTSLPAWTTLTMPATIAAGSVFVANSTNVLSAVSNTTYAGYFLRNDRGTISWALPLLIYYTEGYSKNNTTLSPVMTSGTLLISARYLFRVYLNVTANATGGHKYAMDFSGTPVFIRYHVYSVDDTADTVVISERCTADGEAEGSAGGETIVHTVIEGTIGTASTGTLSVMFAQNVASGTSSILDGSWMELTYVADYIPP